MLTFEEAKNQAERIAKTISLKNQLMLREPFLEELFLEEEHCWMFFVKELFDGQLNVVLPIYPQLLLAKKERLELYLITTRTFIKQFLIPKNYRIIF